MLTRKCAVGGTSRKCPYSHPVDRNQVIRLSRQHCWRGKRVRWRDRDGDERTGIVVSLSAHSAEVLVYLVPVTTRTVRHDQLFSIAGTLPRRPGEVDYEQLADQLTANSMSTTR